jgi:hypothetical protein
MGVSIPFFLGFMVMGFTYFGRHKAMLYVGRLLSGTMNGATTPVSQIYVMFPEILHLILFLSIFFNWFEVINESLSNLKYILDK